MHIEDIEYSSNGLRLVGELAVDDSQPGKRAAVLVSHEGGGLTDHAKNIARTLAPLGYVAFALDYYGDGKPLPSEEIPARFAELSRDPPISVGEWGLTIHEKCPPTGDDGGCETSQHTRIGGHFLDAIIAQP